MMKKINHQNAMLFSTGSNIYELTSP